MSYLCKHECEAGCILITELVSPSLCPMDGGKVVWEDLSDKESE